MAEKLSPTTAARSATTTPEQAPRRADPARLTGAGMRGWPRALSATVERRAPAFLTLLIFGYFLVFTGLNIHRSAALRQGFDVLFYEQPIWNTAHGRPFAQSMMHMAPTQLGLDLVLFELWVAPFYALWQSENMLFALVSL